MNCRRRSYQAKAALRFVLFKFIIQLYRLMLKLFIINRRNKNNEFSLLLAIKQYLDFVVRTFLDHFYNLSYISILFVQGRR